ncbi:nuclear transport factor 2 family protein [Exiguobacterium aestuarii]|uniref:Nuclear transport factor 2 family protein n=1 Tax=Exiguobacterium aestuarii TaxID=273527 RepID=A0ABW2PL37_9BACL|nr:MULTISPECIES: nuclear transport factor 2 family protein [Exiguobacterium]MCT4787634.1 nuclear transport factor 2 family protein [Exiguobacterium aestuarii]
MKKWLIPLLLVFTLGACGNDEEAIVEETKRALPDAVMEVYADYQAALESGDAEALAAIDYAGRLTDIPATGAVTRQLAPGDIYESWVNEDEDVAFLVHEMVDQDGNPLPNRLSKVAVKDDGEWSLVITPTALPEDVIAEVGELLIGVQANEYGVNAEANARLAEVPEDEAGPIYDRVNAQTDYTALEADNNVFLLMAETLTVEENQAIMADYFKAYEKWYTDNEATLREAAATEDPIEYIETLDPLKTKLEEAIDGFDEQLVDPSFG